MKKTVNRPQRLDLADLDCAIEQAVQRVTHAHEMSAQECASVSGGALVLSRIIIAGGILATQLNTNILSGSVLNAGTIDAGAISNVQVH
ncbi:MAG: hypothetical protein V4582_22200 [Pseudomonadota bacterium]